MGVKEYFAIAIGLLSIEVYAQNAPVIEWQKSLGGSENDYAYDVEQTTDGGFIVAGTTYSNDGDVVGWHTGYWIVPFWYDSLPTSDIWIAKLNSSGSLQWQKCLGGSSYDWAYDIQQTTDGGYIVAGGSSSEDGDVSGNHGSSDYWIVQLDSSGNIQWQKCYGGTGLYGELISSIQQTVDEGFIVAGTSGSNDGDVSGNHGDFDYWIVKIDNSGNLQWQKSLGGSKNDYAQSVQQTSDRGYIIAGWSDSHDGDITDADGSTNYWIVKLDSSGNLQWQKSLGGLIGTVSYGTSAIQTLDSGYAVAGYSGANNGDITGNHGGSDYWIVKLDNSGELQWQKCLGGSYDDSAHSIEQTTDKGFIVAGSTNSSDGDVSLNQGFQDYWIVKLDSLGNLTWQKSLGGTGSDKPTSIHQTVTGGFIVSGGSSSNDGDASGHHGYTNTQDCWIVKLEDMNGVEDSKSVMKPSISVFPNPNNGNVTIEITLARPELLVIEIFDVLGRKVFEEDEGITSGVFTKHLDLKNVYSGTYFLKVIHNGQQEMRKMVIN